MMTTLFTELPFKSNVQLQPQSPHVIWICLVVIQTKIFKNSQNPTAIGKSRSNYQWWTFTTSHGSICTNILIFLLSFPNYFMVAEKRGIFKFYLSIQVHNMYTGLFWVKICITIFLNYNPHYCRNKQLLKFL